MTQAQDSAGPPIRRRHRGLARHGRRRQTRRRPGWEPEPLADALGLLACGLRAGLPPAAAVRVTAESTEWGRAESGRIAAVVEALGQGSPAGRLWLQPDDDAQARAAYRVVGAVWDLAIETGAPLADAVLALSDHLREETRVRGHLAALAAGPRASQRLLTLLPVIGPVLAVLIGADPADLYLRSPIGAASATLGGVLAAIGWRWSGSMVQVAARPRRYTQAAQSGT